MVGEIAGHTHCICVVHENSNDSLVERSHPTAKAHLERSDPDVAVADFLIVVVVLEANRRFVRMWFILTNSLVGGAAMAEQYEAIGLAVRRGPVHAGDVMVRHADGEISLLSGATILRCVAPAHWSDSVGCVAQACHETRPPF